MKEKKFTVLIHPETGKERKVKKGASWTVILFGPFALLVRRQFAMAAIWLGVAVGAFVLVDIIFFEIILGRYIPDSLASAMGIGIAVGFGSIANEYLHKQLLKQGYQVQNIGDNNLSEGVPTENQNQ